MGRMSAFRGAAILLAIGLACGAEAVRAAPAAGPGDPSYLPTLTASDHNEVRVGASFDAVYTQHDFEPGAFIDGEFLFASPFPRHEGTFIDALLRPRPDVGVTISTTGGTSQAYAGLTWDFPLIGGFFLEASAGGMIHNGDLDHPHGVHGPRLGSRVLFRESLGLGYDINAHWNVMIMIDHGSDAGLTRRNDGITLAGATVGYRF
jgi:hypothetical protein